MTRRIRRHEEHTNHEAWAIPYGDLVTLLLAFFVVMYAISSVNAGKYRVLSDSLFAAFRGAPRTMDPIQVGEKPNGSGAEIDASIVQSTLQGQQRSSLAPVPVQGGNQQAGASRQQTICPGPAPPPRPHSSAWPTKSLAPWMTSSSRTSSWYGAVSSGSRSRSRLTSSTPAAARTLLPMRWTLSNAWAAHWRPFPNPIRVEGHTDNKPISTVAFYSNWELSAARAGSVVRVLQAQGVGPERLAVIGYGDTRPVQPNDTERAATPIGALSS